MNETKQLVIIGAGGHGKVCADIAQKQGYEAVLFLDDALSVGVTGKVSAYTQYLHTADFFVAIGNNGIREKITKELISQKARMATLIHPSAVVAESATIGRGTVVVAGAVINPDAKIGEGVIVNTCASVDHDCVIGDYAHVAVGARICGTVTVGKRTWIGAGATVINNVSVCADCLIGAGAVVTGDCKEAGTYVGVPAKKIK